ncbi:MAG: hypothetical protein MK212_17795 [Saprospiraceae bacterium]|nr:hypothetical protein [Saprospiraceae bacterium]
MKLSLENQHREKSQTNNAEMSEQKLQERLEQKYKPRPYSERWSKVRLSALFISFCSNSFSFWTGAAALTYFVYLQFGQFLPLLLILILGGGLSLIIAGCLEVLKRSSSSNLLRIGLAEKSWSGSNVFGLVLLVGVSIGLSFWMSRQLPNLLNVAPTAPVAQLESIEALDARYQKMIDEKQTSINEFKKKGTSHWRYNKIENAIHALEQAHISERKAAIERNEIKLQQVAQAHQEALANHQNENTQNANILGYITIASELVFLLTMFYVEWYDWQCLLERVQVQAKIQYKNPTLTETAITEETVEETKVETEDPPKEVIQEEQAQQRTIIQGFMKQGNKGVKVDLEPKLDPDLTPQTLETNQDFNTNTNTMKTSRMLVNTSDFSKETVSGNSPTTTSVLGVIEHKNERTGEVEELTQKEVTKRLRTYYKRVNATLEQLKECLDPQKKIRLKETLTRRTQKLKYWKEKLSQFKTVESL